MSLTDKNIDKVFQDAAMHSKAPEYKDAYWNEFESILNAEQKKKGALWIWFSAGTLAFVLLSSLLFVNNNKSQLASLKTNTTKKTKDFNEVKTVKTHRSSTYTKSEFKTSAKELKSEIQAVNHIKTQKSSNNLIVADSFEEVKQAHSTNSFTNGSFTASKNVNETLENQLLDQEIENLNLKKEALQIGSEKTEKTLLPVQKLKSKKGWSFYTQLNAGISEAYNENILDRSLTADISLNVAHKFEKLVLRSGLGLAATTNSAIAFSDRSKVYGYSSNSYTHNIVYDNLYELYVPLEIGIELKGYTFGAGLKTNYLVGTTLHFTSLEDDQLVIDENYKNIEAGLNKLSFSGHVFVDKTLTNQISLGAKVGTLLTDRYAKENVFEFGENRKNPLFGQLYLKYNF